jgi:hypothetical protein
MTLRKTLVAAGVLVFMLGMLLYLYFPAVPRSVLGWVALVVLGLPVWLFLEWLGEAVLGSRFFARRSSGARILLGVPACIVLGAVAVILVRFVQSLVLAA